MKKYPVLQFAALLAVFLTPASVAVAAEPPPTDVVVIEHGAVANAFAQGRPMLVNSLYKIQAGRRVTAPGEAEIHEHDTDIFYITEGTATLVTGGEAEDPKIVGPGEARAKKTSGGKPRLLQKGDVVVIPAGVPHWFTEVSNPFLYFVVKVTK
jgi:quercetin dioxygenase-like cupin family protein